ncbi:hypothetical protein [Sediminicoccus sp. KRV36]|uniref:alpha/beta hydrolase family protein n=1 Tax=Sediminicoccus sp. KRV36 TaxID=3133721 RepID=UPI00201084F1|nr:hypothetical protein [Sediminicoccus rosea]UPY35891.1 hypothetical protein LHU95_16930 [Sediminicoccus rosea]
MRRFLAALLVLLASQLPARADGGAVSTRVIQVPDGAAPAIETSLWYPAESASPGAALRGRALPLVVFSHGSGAFSQSHADTAMALAGAGFIVAAPTHPGDNFRDRSGATDLAARTRQFVAVIGHVAESWSPGAVDSGRIAAFGYSAGAFTVLVAAGGMPDRTLIAAHCAAHPEVFECRLIANGAPTAIATAPAALVRSPLPLRALVVAAPALGYTFGPGTLAALSMPVQLWQAAEDAVLPAPFYAEPVRAALPRPPEFHLVAGAGHYDFQAPCTEILARAVPAICTSRPGFDRAAFHTQFNAEIVRFLTAALRP